MYSRALIALGGSMSRIAGRHFAPDLSRLRSEGLEIFGTRSGAASVLERLAELRQYEVLVAVGFAGALAAEIRMGDFIVPTSACDYATSNGRIQHSDAELCRRLAESCGPAATVHIGRIGTVRSIVRRGSPHATAMLNAGLLAVEMELACLFGHLKQDGCRVAAVLVCSDHVFQAPLPEATTGIRGGLPLASNVLAAAISGLDLAMGFLTRYGEIARSRHI